MKPDELKRFQQIEEIFCAAVDRPPGAERAALVCTLSGGDDDLCREVTLLLEEHQRIRAAVERPAGSQQKRN